MKNINQEKEFSLQENEKSHKRQYSGELNKKLILISKRNNSVSSSQYNEEEGISKSSLKSERNSQIEKLNIQSVQNFNKIRQIEQKKQQIRKIDIYHNINSERDRNKARTFVESPHVAESNLEFGKQESQTKLSSRSKLKTAFLKQLEREKQQSMAFKQFDSSTEFQTKLETTEDFQLRNNLQINSLLELNIYPSLILHQQCNMNFEELMFAQQAVSSLSNINEQEEQKCGVQSQESIQQKVFQQQNVQELVKDQSGCRLLQKYLDERDQIITDQIFSQISISLDFFNQVVQDQYGNYLCQKLAEECTGQQFLKILEAVKPAFLKICLSSHGTRVIQKLIEIIATKYNPFIIDEPKEDIQQKIEFYYLLLWEVQNEIKKNLLALAQDSNGNHILQKCLVCLRFEDKQFLYDEACVKCIQIAMNKHGCCIIQKFIEFGSPLQQQQIICIIFQNLSIVIQDQFANYIIQYLLQLPALDSYKSYIGNFILQNFIFYARQRYSSNVMEKCIINNADNFKDKLINAIIKSDTVHYLLVDRFANYVIQRCLSCASQFQQEKLLNQIIDHIDSIQQIQFGFKILQKLDQLYNIKQLQNYRLMLLQQQQYIYQNYQNPAKILSLQDISCQMPIQFPYQAQEFSSFNNLQQLPNLNQQDLASLINNLDLNFEINDNNNHATKDQMQYLQ